MNIFHPYNSVTPVSCFLLSITMVIYFNSTYATNLVIHTIFGLISNLSLRLPKLQGQCLTCLHLDQCAWAHDPAALDSRSLLMCTTETASNDGSSIRVPVSHRLNLGGIQSD